MKNDSGVQGEKNARHSPEMMMEYYGLAWGSVDFMLDGDQNSRW